MFEEDEEKQLKHRTILIDSTDEHLFKFLKDPFIDKSKVLVVNQETENKVLK